MDSQPLQPNVRKLWQVAGLMLAVPVALTVLIQHLQLTWSALQKAFRLANVRFHIPGARRRASDLEDDEALSWFQLLGQVEPPGNVP